MIVNSHCREKKHLDYYADTRPDKVMPKGRFYAGSVGVDSGSVMIVDPCYLVGENNLQGQDKWNQLCELRDKNNYNPLAFRITNGYSDAVISSTNFGDGDYPVFVTFDKNGIPTKMEIIFTRNTTDKDRNNFGETKTILNEQVKRRLEQGAKPYKEIKK